MQVDRFQLGPDLLGLLLELGGLVLRLGGSYTGRFCVGQRPVTVGPPRQSGICLVQLVFGVGQARLGVEPPPEAAVCTVAERFLHLLSQLVALVTSSSRSDSAASRR